jgi:hypothetical protein
MSFREMTPTSTPSLSTGMPEMGRDANSASTSASVARGVVVVSSRCIVAGEPQFVSLSGRPEF